MANTLYADDGSVRVTVVTGTSITGLYAPDRSMNVIEGIPGVHRGLYHPCGAMLVNINSESSTTSIPAYSKDGFRNIALPPFSNTLTGAMRCTIVSGSTAVTPPSGTPADVEFNFITKTYKEGPLYKDLRSNISCTRASTATYVNEFGVLATAPIDTIRLTHELNTGKPLGLLLEPAATNLIRNSQFFGSLWTKGGGVTITDNAAYAPDGSLTAAKVETVEGATNVTCYQENTVTSNTVYTISCYIKQGTLAVADVNLAVYDVTNSSFIFNNVITNSATTNGWTRITATFTTPLTCVSVRMYVSRTTSGLPSSSSGYYYAWGAQLELGSVATSYIPTNAGAVTRATDTGLVLNANAFSAGLTTTTTNLCIQSESYNTGWSLSGGITVTPDTTVDPLATSNADTITVDATINQGLYRTITVLPNTKYTFSQYVKLGTFLAAEYKFAIFDSTAGSFLFVDIVPNFVPSAGVWTRFDYTFTTPSTCNNIRVYPFRSSTATSGGTFFLWGSQLEQSDVPTRYVSTTTVPVTLTQFSEFTVFAQFISKPTGATSNGVLFGVTNSLQSANETIFVSHTNNLYSSNITGGSDQTPSFTSAITLDGATNKVALGFDLNDTAFSVNGRDVILDTSATVITGTINFATIGSSATNTSSSIANYIISRISFWKTRRPDSDLQSMTV